MSRMQVDTPRVRSKRLIESTSDRLTMPVADDGYGDWDWVIWKRQLLTRVGMGREKTAHLHYSMRECELGENQRTL